MQREEAIVTYFWIILLAFAVVLTVKGILQWAGNPKRRQSRLKIVSICAFLFLIVMLVLFNLEEIHRFIEGIEKVNGSATTLMVNTIKILIKGLLLAVVASFSIIVALIGILFAIYGMWAIGQVIKACFKNGYKKKDLEKNMKEKADKIVSLFKISAFKITIVGGILAIYIMLPIIMVEATPTNSLVEHWIVGVNNIAGGTSEEKSDNADKTGSAGEEASGTADKAGSAGEEASGTADKAGSAGEEANDTADKAGSAGEEANDTTDEADNATGEADNPTDKAQSTGNKLFENLEPIAKYTLMFVAVLGVGYVAFGILYEIVKERLAKRNVFLDEYSSSIGVLAVGVALLLLASGFPNEDTQIINVLYKIVMPFVMVIFVIAFGILTLEIVNLLMDMKERLIRRMARYLFVLLVGLCTSIFVKVLLMVFNTLVSILGRKNVILDDVEEHMERMCNRIMIKLMEDMEEELNRKDTNDKKLRIPFKAFKGRVVRKEEGK